MPETDPRLIELAFAVLLMAVLLSGLAERSVLSTAVLLLAGGFALGEGSFGLVPLHPDDPPVTVLADLALFSDGMRIGGRTGMADEFSRNRGPRPQRFPRGTDLGSAPSPSPPAEWPAARPGCRTPPPWRAGP